MPRLATQQPREIIFGEITRQTIKLPALSSRLTHKNGTHLATKRNESHCPRLRTQPDYSSERTGRKSEVSRLREALRMNKSEILGELSRKMTALQELQLVQGGAVKRVLYSGHIRIPTVHNDYHSSKTNAGYSRNKFGGIYPK